MAHNPDFYKGKSKKKRSFAVIPFAIIVGLAAIAIVTFYGLQKYAVITKDDVSVRFSGFEETDTSSLLSDNGVKEFETVDTPISFEAPDYGAQAQVVDGRVPELRAIFVPSDELYRAQIEEYAARLSKGNALVLEMKPATGYLNWNCQAEEVQKYGMYTMNSNVDDLALLITELHGRGIYLVAQISCCLDELYASRCNSVALTDQFGMVYRDQMGTWLDAYNVNLRRYVVEMVEELYAMGFDEVVLANVAHPRLGEDVSVNYTRDMSTTPSAANAVLGFAVSVAQDLQNRDGYLSIYIDSATALVRTDTGNGQSGPFFLKLFDRVYYNTDKYKYSFNISDIESSVTVGVASDRFIPVVENYLPDSTSWVLISTEDV